MPFTEPGPIEPTSKVPLLVTSDEQRLIEKHRAQRSIEVKPISRNLILQRMQQVIAAAVLSGCDVDPHDEPFVALMAFMREWGWIK